MSYHIKSVGDITNGNVVKYKDRQIEIRGIWQETKVFVANDAFVKGDAHNGVMYNAKLYIKKQPAERNELIEKIDLAAEYLSVKKNSLAYKSAVELVSYSDSEVITGRYRNCGRFSGSRSWTFETSALLTAAGIEHTCYNVAPRGGRAGERIKLL